MYYFDLDVATVLGDLTRTLLGFVAGIAFLFIVGAGVYYISTNGDPAKQKRAKSAITYALMGLLIVMFSYAILELIDTVVVD